jgi:long-subunit fatty acid transport protein
MKGRRPVFFVLLLLNFALFPQYKPWYNQYNFTYGTKAMSMGNAFTAVADDLTAVFWNPAGLAALRSPEFYFAYQAESQTHVYDPQAKVIPGDTMQYDYRLNSKLQQINFFSVSAPAEFWKMKWGFALSYYRYIPYGFKGSAEVRLTHSQNSLISENTVNFKGSEGIDVLAFSTATGISEYFALGCTLQQFFGSGTMHSQTIDQAGDFHQQYNENLRGRNLIIGMMFRPIKALSLGFTFHSGLKNNFDSTLLTWEVDKQGVDVNLSAKGALAQVVIPAQYSLGAALQLASWLNLSFDYSRIDWQKGTIGDYYASGSLLPYPQKADFSSEQKNVSNLRLGMEIDLPLRRLLLHLRSGWFADKQLYADSSGQAVKISGYAAGVGCELSKYLQMEIAYLRQNGAWPENSYFLNSRKVSGKYSANLLKFSLTYRFGRIFKE